MAEVDARPAVFRGKVYTGPDDMPAEVRQAYEQWRQALSQVSPGGAPDAWEEGSVPPVPAAVDGGDPGQPAAAGTGDPFPLAFS